MGSRDGRYFSVRVRYTYYHGHNAQRRHYMVINHRDRHHDYAFSLAADTWHNADGDANPMASRMQDPTLHLYRLEVAHPDDGSSNV